MKINDEKAELVILAKQCLDDLVSSGGHCSHLKQCGPGKPCDQEFEVVRRLREFIQKARGE